MSIIEKLHTILNNVKGFSSGYSECKNNKMIIQYEGELYLTEFKKINISEEDLKAEEYKSLDKEFVELAVAVNKYLAKGE